MKEEGRVTYPIIITALVALIGSAQLAHADAKPIPPLGVTEKFYVSMPDERRLEIHSDGHAEYSASLPITHDNSWIAPAGTFAFATVYALLQPDPKDPLRHVDSEPDVTLHAMDGELHVALSYTSPKGPAVEALFAQFDAAADKRLLRDVVEQERLAEYPPVTIPAIGETSSILIVLPGGENLEIDPAGRAVYKAMQASIPTEAWQSGPKAFDFAALYETLGKGLRPLSRAETADAQVYFMSGGSGTGYYTAQDDLVKNLFRKFHGLKDKVHLLR